MIQSDLPAIRGVNVLWRSYGRYAKDLMPMSLYPGGIPTGVRISLPPRQIGVLLALTNQPSASCPDDPRQRAVSEHQSCDDRRDFGPGHLTPLTIARYDTSPAVLSSPPSRFPISSWALLSSRSTKPAFISPAMAAKATCTPSTSNGTATVSFLTTLARHGGQTKSSALSHAA